MPPPGGTRTPLADVANALTRRPAIATYTWGGAGTGFDVTQFKDTFVPGGTFSPGYPIVPTEEQRVRSWDYPVSFNTTYTPRSYEPISFKELRALADNHDITRLCIETRKDQIEALSWQIRPRDENNVSSDAEARSNKLTEFWQHPDGNRAFATWLRELIEELLVIDAPAIEPRYNRVGDIIAVDTVDGSTIKVLLDETGRTPEPPAPAYEQVIHGKPWVLLADGSRENTKDKAERLITSDNLIYLPRNPRVHKAYGFSPVEQIVLTVNIGLRRQFRQLSYFTSGSVPAGVANAPDAWGPEQIAQYQAWFDSYLSGNDTNKARIIWGPSGAKYQALHEAPYKDQFDEWLARIVCFAFSLPAFAFAEHYNRATAQTAQAAALSEGLAPLLSWVKRLIDSVIQNRMGYQDLEFAWDENRELDPQIQTTIHVDRVKAGIETLNEARDDLGLDPIEGGDEPMFITPSGPVLLRDVLAGLTNPSAEAEPGTDDAGGAPGKGSGKPQGKSAPTDKQKTAATKPTISMEEAEYTDDGPSLLRRCRNCSMYRAPDSCTLVEGDIHPEGYCKYFDPAG